MQELECESAVEVDMTTARGTHLYQRSSESQSVDKTGRYG